MCIIRAYHYSTDCFLLKFNYSIASYGSRFGVCLDVFLHYVRLAAYVACNIILLVRWIYGTCGIKMMIISVFRT